MPMSTVPGSKFSSSPDIGTLSLVGVVGVSGLPGFLLAESEILDETAIPPRIVISAK